MSAWTAGAIVSGLWGSVAAPAGPAAGEAASKGEARTLMGVLALIIGLLVIMMVLVGMSAVRRRVRLATAARAAGVGEKGRERRGTRRVDAWAEAGRRAELAPPEEGYDEDEGEDRPEGRA